MPSVERNSTTVAPCAGSSTSKTVPSRFNLLQEILEAGNQWDSDPSSGYSDYNFNNDSDTVASSMLSIFAQGGKKKPKKKKGKGKAKPAL